MTRQISRGAMLALLLPYSLLLLSLLLAPVLYLVFLSVMTHDPRTVWAATFTIENYTRLFEGYYAEILIRSFRISLVSTFFAVVFGVPLAYWLARSTALILTIGLFLVVLPMMVSTVIRAFGWMILLNRNGLLNSLLESAGMGRWITIMNTESAVVLALVHICLPLAVLPMLASIEKIPRRYEEAYASLGGRPFGTFRHVIIPLAMPGIRSGALLSFLVASSVVVTPALMGGRTGRMVGNEVYDQAITAVNWPFSSALALVSILAVFTVLVLLWALPRLIRSTKVS